MKGSVHGDLIRVELVGWLRRNYSRNIISSDVGHLVISESKNDPERVDIHWLNENGSPCNDFSFENLSGRPAAVTTSVASKRFVNDRAFLPANGVFLTKNKTGILVVDLLRKGVQ